MEKNTSSARRDRSLIERIALRWSVGVIAILITIWLSRMLPPVDLYWAPAWRVVIFVPLLTVANTILRPVLKLLSMPINCMTFGLFSFVVNAGLFWGAGYFTDAHMNIWGALFGSVVYATLSTIMSWPIKEKRS